MSKHCSFPYTCGIGFCAPVRDVNKLEHGSSAIKSNCIKQCPLLSKEPHSIAGHVVYIITRYLSLYNIHIYQQKELTTTCMYLTFLHVLFRWVQRWNFCYIIIVEKNMTHLRPALPQDQHYRGPALTRTASWSKQPNTMCAEFFFHVRIIQMTRSCNMRVSTFWELLTQSGSKNPLVCQRRSSSHIHYMWVTCSMLVRSTTATFQEYAHAHRVLILCGPIP